MEVMSYTYYLFLVIIVFSHYVSSLSTETQEERSKEESRVDDLVDQTSSTENKVNPSSAEKIVDETSSAENKVDETSSPEVNNRRIPTTFDWQSGIVPFVISKHYDTIITQRILLAMQTIEGSSCVVFKDMEQEPPLGHFPAITWLSIENPEGIRECSHTTMGEEGVLGVTKAILVIGYDCMMSRDILHALLHALGFRDEVTHPQRNLYIRVMWQNIQPKYRKLFWMRTGETPHKMVEYDSMSIMHFHHRAFSVNGGATIMPLVPELAIYPSDRLSQIDVMKLRLAFGHECKKRNVGNLLKTCHNALNNDDQEQTHPEDPTDPTDTENSTDSEDPEDPTDSEGSADTERRGLVGPKRPLPLLGETFRKKRGQ